MPQTLIKHYTHILLLLTKHIHISRTHIMLMYINARMQCVYRCVGHIMCILLFEKHQHEYIRVSELGFLGKETRQREINWVSENGFPWQGDYTAGPNA